MTLSESKDEETAGFGSAQQRRTRNNKSHIKQRDQYKQHGHICKQQKRNNHFGSAQEGKTEQHKQH
jgi:hypothetical protein